MSKLNFNQASSILVAMGLGYIGPTEATFGVVIARQGHIPEGALHVLLGSLAVAAGFKTAASMMLRSSTADRPRSTTAQRHPRVSGPGRSV